MQLTNYDYLNAIKVACTYHSVQRYGTMPYYKHLEDVERILEFKGLVSYDHKVGAWLHDILEDTPLSYNDLRNQFGSDVADAVYLISEYRGRNRAERKPLVYYQDIAYNPLAVALKLGDRISNIQFGGLSSMYVKEHEHFQIIYSNSSDFEPSLVGLIKYYEAVIDAARGRIA